MPRAHLSPLFVDLNLDDAGGVLNNFRHVCAMSATDLAQDALKEVRKATDHPVLPEDASSEAEGGVVGLDHAEGAVNGPEAEEDNEEMVDGPEALVIGPPRLFDRGEEHGHQGEEHHVAGPAWACEEVDLEEASEAKFLFGGKLGEVVPVGDGVDPGEEDKGEGDEFMEGDVLVERDNAVEGRLAGEGDEGSAYWEEDEGDVEVEDESCRSGNGVGQSECCSGVGEIVLQVIIHKSKSKDHSMHQHEDRNY